MTYDCIWRRVVTHKRCIGVKWVSTVYDTMDVFSFKAFLNFCHSLIGMDRSIDLSSLQSTLRFYLLGAHISC